METGTKPEMGADMHTVITKMIRDMKIVGLFTIIGGALNCLSIIGAIFGVPILIAGIRLRESAEQFTGWLQEEPGALFRALERQQRYFFIQMVLIVAGLIIAVICFAIVIMFIAAGASGLFNNW